MSEPVDFRQARQRRAELSQSTADRLPPHAPDHEQAVLGGCLLAPEECLHRVIEATKANPDAFYLLVNRVIFESLLALNESGVPCDPTSVIQHLRERKELESIGGAAYLASLPDKISSGANIEYHLAKLLDMWRRRRLIGAFTEGIAAAYEIQDTNEMMDVVAAEVSAVDEQDGDTKAQPKFYLQEYINEVEARFNLRGALPGLATGFHDYDRREGGLRFREMVVIGARPYEGKTAFACNIIERACIVEKSPTLFLSLEMTRPKLLDRLTALLAGLDIAKLGRADFRNGEMDAISRSNLKINAAPLYIEEHTGGMSSAQASACIRRYVRQHGVKLVVLDYLQKISSVGRYEKNTYGLGDTCKRLRHAAVQSGVALVCLAQLNREIDKGKKARGPRMSDLADSKAIEAEADTVVLLDRNGDNRNLLIPKSRNSGGNTVYLQFDPVTLRFKNQSPLDNYDR